MIGGRVIIITIGGGRLGDEERQDGVGEEREERGDELCARAEARGEVGVDSRCIIGAGEEAGVDARCRPEDSDEAREEDVEGRGSMLWRCG
jgi:hypothetical protein